MKKVLRLLALPIAVFGIIGGSLLTASEVEATTLDDVVRIDQSITDADARLESTISDYSQTDKELLADAYGEYGVALDEAYREYNYILSEAESDDWRSVINQLSLYSKMMSNAAASVQTSVDTEYMYDFEVSTLDYYKQSYQETISEVYLYVDEKTAVEEEIARESWLWAGGLTLAILCLVATIIFAFVSRSRHGDLSTKDKDGKEISLKNVRRNIVVGAAILVLGVAIPAAQYWWGMTHPNADGSFTYKIYFWPIAFGAVLFATAIVSYISTYSKIKKIKPKDSPVNK